VPMGSGIGKMAATSEAPGSRKRKLMDHRMREAAEDALEGREASEATHDEAHPHVQLLGLNPELLHSVLGFLSAVEAHQVLDAPICRGLRAEVMRNSCVWKELCCSRPWLVSRADLDALSNCFSATARGGQGMVAHPPPGGVVRRKSMHLRRQLRCSLDASVTAGAYRELHRTLLCSVQGLRKESCRPSQRLAYICAVMAQFAKVKGIQMEALQACLPLLQAEPVRRVAQDSALAPHIITCIHSFQDPTLQCMALHALVLLARPLGGREGAVHVGIAPSLPSLQGPKGGICSVIKLMDQHPNHSELQAMACWSLVNFALNPSAKAYMLGQGAIHRVLQAMHLHPKNRDVQFRAIFALINLVVPDGGVSIENQIDDIVQQLLAAIEVFTEDGRLINRASLVLQNLSLNELNHGTLKRPRVQRLLQRCLVRFGAEDPVLAQSIRATLMRLFGSAVEELGLSALTLHPPTSSCFPPRQIRIPVTF